MSSTVQSPQTQLPKSLSGLLELAIKDARSLDPSLYHPRHRDWYFKPISGPCQLCLAGSVIAGTLKPAHYRLITPTYFGVDMSNLLFAIDSMRCGYWCRAFYQVHGSYPTGRIRDRLSNLPVPQHGSFIGWTEFRSHLDSLESILPALREIESAAFPG